jgi:phosphotransferase system HPr (HPr) family protein
MKYLEQILKEEFKIVEHAEKEIILEEHTLNFTPQVNALHHELINAKEGFKEAIQKYKERHEIRESKSLHDILKLSLARYDNRTIQIEHDEMDYDKLIDVLSGYKDVDFVAAYKRFWFEPLEKELWKKHEFRWKNRMVLYAFDKKDKREAEAIRNAAEIIGSLVAEKRKKYGKYASRTYNINDNGGIHARSGALIVGTAVKYSGDVWARIDKAECDAKCMMQMLIMETTKKNKLTMLYKPREKSAEFYNELENLKIGDEKLLVRIG